MNQFMNWIRGSVATTMFFNRRSAVLQQISNVNFLNWADNNPIAAAKAFADFKQYSEDFVFIINSNYLKERRGGLKTDVNAADLAEAIKRGGYNGFLARLLQAGFSLTQYGDSFAIATGGATFYRNRINTYLKQGKTQEEAEQQAFLDFQEVSEETQQSARPDRLSQEQTNILGRTFLAFQNTPMQMTRLAVKAGKDLIARRGDPKEKIFKMAYYGVAQSIIFSALQTALIGDMFSYGDDDDEDTEKQKLKNTKTKRLINNVVDSFLKGTGIYGVFVTTAKNAALKFYEQEQRKEEGKRPDYAYVMIEALNVSPPIGIKARNFYGALKNYEYNERYIKEIGYDLNNPALDIGSAATESMFNIPAHSVLSTIRDIDAMTQENVDTWHRIALGLGWHTWDLGITNEDLQKTKEEIKERNKQIRSSKKQKDSGDSLKKEYFKKEKIK
jgi:riboflavin synthase